MTPQNTEVLVIGSGLAGATAALTAADAGRSVTLVTKTEEPLGGNTAHAQGGIVFRGDNDSPEKLKQDILAAGAGHCYTPAVDILVNEGPELVQKILLDRLGVPFSTSGKGDEYHRTAEAAHSIPRILHAADRTGKVISEKIIAAIAKHPNISILTASPALDLLTTTHQSIDPQHTYQSPRCFGALLFNPETGLVEPLFARQTVLATGGLGQLFRHTTNPPESRGDGIAMAWRAGVRCINLHYIQFHPTALYHSSGRFLISEAMRGEGARLIDESGREFMTDFHPEGNLAPRDVVARAIHTTLIDHQLSHVYLDITHKPAHWIRDRFPAIFEHCMSLGFDICREPIPVVPAAHYSCGGIAVDLDGHTSIGGLYAAGEVACTGVHGANRLASTSLLECLVWGYRAGTAAGMSAQQSRQPAIPEINPWEYEHDEMDPALIEQDWLTIRNIMWNYVGLIRTPNRLRRARTMLRQLQMEVEDFYKQAQLSNAIIGLRNGVQTALAILFSASEVRESRGCHYVTSDG